MTKMRLYGWQHPGSREKAQETLARKIEMGIAPHVYTDKVGRIDRDEEQKAMQRVKYD